MTSLTFYGGVDEIGGNKILLQDKDTKVFLDFGMSFGKRGKFFEEFVNPRLSNGITDYLTMGLIPDIKGIYRDDLLEMAGRKPEQTDIDAVLLTHAHADHANYISFLNQDIPIHMGAGCHLILKALADRGARSLESEILDYKERPTKDHKGEKPIPRTIKEFRTGDKFKVGDLEVEPIHVDHSVPAAYGFIIYTSFYNPELSASITGNIIKNNPLKTNQSSNQIHAKITPPETLSLNINTEKLSIKISEKSEIEIGNQKIDLKDKSSIIVDNFKGSLEINKNNPNLIPNPVAIIIAGISKIPWGNNLHKTNPPKAIAV